MAQLVTNCQWVNDYHRRSACHPAFSFLDPAFCNAVRTHQQWPAVSTYNSLFPDAPYRFIRQEKDTIHPAHSYDSHIHHHQEIPTRQENLHDFFNAMIWHHFPRSKLLLNTRQAHASNTNSHSGNKRSPAQNILTRIDESAAICFLPKNLADALRKKSWATFFLTHREQLINEAHIYIFGHSLFEKCLKPYIGMCAHALIIDSSHHPTAKPNTAHADQALANSIQNHHTQLYPLPLLGLPNWHPDNTNPSFYDNTNYFRPAT